MIIHTPTTEIRDDRVRISAQIEFEQAPFRFDTPIWFEYPRAYAPDATRSCGAFATALLPIAMYFEERLVLHGTLSSRLEYSLREVQRILNFRLPEKLSIIPIHFDGYGAVENKPKYKGKALCAFSGGGDAWYTILHQPTHQISHTLFIHGFDVPLREKAVYDTLIQKYTPLLATRGIELIPAATNIEKLRPVTGLSEAWSWIENYFIIGAGLFLEDSFPLFYFSDDSSFDYVRPSGLYHFRMLSLFGTEQMRVRTYGDPATKLERLAVISEHPITHDALRVCMARKPTHIDNCGRCTKCLLIMTHLDMLGDLKRYTTFAKPLDRAALRRIRHADPQYALIPWERIQTAYRYGRLDVAFDYTYIHLASALTRLIR